MNHYDLVIKNGMTLAFDPTLKSIKNEFLNIGISHGKITSLSVKPSDTAHQVFDAQHLHVLPGVIDSQVHFREPGLTHKEDIESGTRAALLGGVTTIFEMPNTSPSTTTEENFLHKCELAKNRAHCHYGFFIGGSPDNTEHLNFLEKMPHCAGVKVFLGSSFGNLLIDEDEVFKKILQNGKRPVIIHSEDEQRLRARKYLAENSAHVQSHPIWRDEESALISTQKSIAFARQFQRPVHILHVSSMEEMQFLSKNKDICTVEILPQFLTFSAPECYEKWGTLAQQNPPIRDRRHLEFLWKAIHDGTVDIIGSDHAPHTIEEKNKKYPSSPSGMPGVQTLLVSMLDHVSKNKISLNHLVTLLSENPRKLFGLKNKGRIQIGYDADLTIVDLKKSQKVEKSWLASKSNWSLFENMTLTGWPTDVFLEGQHALVDGQIRLPHLGKAVEFN